METKTIGNKIAAARKEKGMSQAALAGLLFISPQAVGKWERGESFPDILTINRLAEIFGVTLTYFSENPEAAKPEITLAHAGWENVRERSDDPADGGLPIAERLLTDFSASDLTQGNFSEVSAPGSKFNASELAGADFSGADLTGSVFKASNITGANFDRANLTDCIFSTSGLPGASFRQTILVRTKFDITALTDAAFTDVTFTEVKLNMIDLRATVLERCRFQGVEFKHCDLRGMSLAGLTFSGVRFDRSALNEVSFNGATLRDVSFTPRFALTNKFFRMLKSVRFEGAQMDKLTYAALKGVGADVSKVTII